MDRQPRAHRRMMIFVATIFLIACAIAAYFAIEVHPGQANGPANATSSTMP